MQFRSRRKPRRFSANYRAILRDGFERERRRRAITYGRHQSCLVAQLGSQARRAIPPRVEFSTRFAAIGERVAALLSGMIQTIGLPQRGIVMFRPGSPSTRRAWHRWVLVFLLAAISTAHFSAAQCATVSDFAHCSPWVATWGTAMEKAFNGSAPDVTGQTLRLIVHNSVGGSEARIWLSNRLAWRRFASAPRTLP